MFRIGDNTLFLQLLCKGLIELGGEIRIAGCRRLGDGQPYALFPAGQIGISRAGRCPEIAGGRQLDGLFAGRTARGRDEEPVGRGFGIVVCDRKRPVSRGGKGDRCGPLLGGIERIFGLLDGQVPGTGGIIILLAARKGKGKGGREGQPVKRFGGLHGTGFCNQLIIVWLQKLAPLLRLSEVEEDVRAVVPPFAYVKTYVARDGSVVKPGRYREG